MLSQSSDLDLIKMLDWTLRKLIHKFLKPQWTEGTEKKKNELKLPIMWEIDNIMQEAIMH